ncbi:hypothetical protein RIF29_05240 [Crotalaria pallida]|uniref:Uncharacterized protein n=1 Tax=Crotalaria pallida TaxID=3830 RepID=A0AAN9J243_CROPI
MDVANENVPPTQAEPAAVQDVAVGGDSQLGDENGNPKTMNENPVKVSDKESSAPDSADHDHGEWLIVTRRRRFPPKNPQLPLNNDKAVLRGNSKIASGPTAKNPTNGPELETGPNTKTHAIRLDSGKHRREDRSIPTHVLLKNAGKEVYVNPMHTGTPVFETGALFSPQGVFSGVPFFGKDDPHPTSPHNAQVSSPVHCSSMQELGLESLVPESQGSEQGRVLNDVSMHD